MNLKRLLLPGLACGVSATGLVAQTPESQPFFDQKVGPFLQTYCIKCHSGDDARASFYMDRLHLDFSNPTNAGKWAEVMDAINLGDMPPVDEPQPDADTVFEVAEWIGGEIRRAQAESRMKGGQVLLRRLNRDEYANTVVDLLSFDPARTDGLKAMLPTDGTADGFDRIAAALFIDKTQMQRYLDAATYISELAILDAPPEAGKVTWETQKRVNFGGEKTRAHATLGRVQIETGFVPGERRENGILSWNAVNRLGEETDPNDFQIFAHATRIPLNDLVTEGGIYRVRFLAGAYQGAREHPVQMRFSYGVKTPVAATETVEIQGTLEEPQWQEFDMFLRAPTGDLNVEMNLAWNAPGNVRIYHPEYLRLRGDYTRTNDAFGRAKREKAPEAKVRELEAARDQAVAALEAYQGTAYIQNPEIDMADVPKLFLGPIEIEGPIQEWPPPAHVALGIRDDQPENADTLRQVFANFLPRAFRRPVAPDDVEYYVNRILEARQQFGFSHTEALRFGLQSILVSPDFLLIQEPQQEDAIRPLDNFEIANRLSYFLWNSMPDAELFQLAAAGRLTDPAVRRQQVDRMLQDPKIDRFIDSFAGQWLDVRRYGSVQPATYYERRRHAPAYDGELERASRVEPIAFFRHILVNNLPITNFIDSDFLIINQRLAEHYQIPGVVGPEFRKVSIPGDVPRGGVLGMAGLLTLLSDGNRTLPVTRAAWVREKLFHDPPPPPPPGAGEIQPNTEGENLTVRQRLELHRKEPTCASCHAGLDGYGLALENYDAVGAWRTHQDGEGMSRHGAREIDPSGQLKSGRTFSNLAEYKQALLEEQDRFAHAFVIQMLTYALTRPVGVIDQEAVDHIYQQLKHDDFRIQSVVHAITDSELFLTK